LRQFQATTEYITYSCLDAVGSQPSTTQLGITTKLLLLK